MKPQFNLSSVDILLFADKQEFPNIVRTIPPNTKISEFVVDICRHYSWERITLVVSAEREAILTAAAIEVRLEISQRRPDLWPKLHFHPSDSLNYSAKELGEAIGATKETHCAD